MLVILFNYGVNCRLLTHSFQELISWFSIISFRDQIEPELLRAWSLLGAQGFNNDDDEKNNNNNNNNNDNNNNNNTN